jgi:hypothetical protein
MTWLSFRRAKSPTGPHGDDARAALTQSIDALLGGVQMRHEARHVAEGLRAVERRNHLAESIRHAFREPR